LTILNGLGGQGQFTIKEIAARLSRMLGVETITNEQAEKVLAGEILEIGGKAIYMDNAFRIWTGGEQ